jgi:hypothetical protein
MIVALIILAVWLLRGCIPAGTTGPGATGNKPSVPATGTSANALDDRIHAALHALQLADGLPLDTYVYIFTVSTKDGVSALVTLTPLGNAPKKITAQSVATACEDAILAAVPEVTSVEVIDSGRIPVSSKTR